MENDEADIFLKSCFNQEMIKTFFRCMRGQSSGERIVLSDETVSTLRYHDMESNTRIQNGDKDAILEIDSR